MPNSPISRPPVVVIMGHIDHGKSTLLDYIRQSNVVASEAGGITQAVSAYEVEKNDKKLTFIDTPGHAAFAGMRERGAQIADIAILIVSAEDGPKPQTAEALQAIRAAKLPFIVAINKIDRPAANPDRTKQQLAELDVLVEGYGGQVPVAEISAKTGEGVPELLDLILLATELEDFKTTPLAPATGFVLESNRSPKSGITATLIVKDGRLATGDWVVVTDQAARVKRLSDFAGRLITEAYASAPVQVAGWSELPTIGAAFQTFSDKKVAEAAARAHKPIAPTLAAAPAATPSPAQVEIPLILKVDVAGSQDALRREVERLVTPAVSFKILSEGVGQVNEADIKLAGSPTALVLGFNVSVEKTAADLAEKLGVTIQTFDIIYKLAEWLETEVARRTPRVEVEESLGRAKLLKIFGNDKNRQIVGGAVTTGRLVDGKPCKIWRRDAEIGRGKLVELQQQKIKVKEVPQDSQFGALVESKVALAPGDVIEIFDLVIK